MRKTLFAFMFSAAIGHAAAIITGVGPGGVGSCITTDNGQGMGTAIPFILAESWTMVFPATGVTITVHLHNTPRPHRLPLRT
jgi:hypothetical protein